MTPVRLKLENFISHISSVIDFTQFDLALIIGSFEGDSRIANGVGKSSIMDGIRFALYGKARFAVKSKVVRRGKAECRVEFVFSSDSDIYKVVRTLSVKSGDVNVEFYKKNGDKWDARGFTCDTPTATNNKIMKIIGMNDDTFVNIVYFRQNDVSGFADAKVSKKREILKEALQINIWDEFQKVSKSTEKKLAEQQNALEKRMFLLGDIDTELKNSFKEFEKTKSELSRINKEISKLNEVIGGYNDKISSLEVSIAKRDMVNIKELELELADILRRGTEVKERKSQLCEEVKKNNMLIANFSSDCKGLKKRIIAYCRNILVVNHRLRDEIEVEFKSISCEKVPVVKFTIEDVNKNRLLREKHKSDLDVCEFDLNQLTSLEPGDECPVCLTEFNNPKDIRSKRNAKKERLEQKISKSKQAIEAIEHNIAEIQNAINVADKAVVEIERTRLIISKCMTSVSEATRGNESIQSELKLLASEWQRLKDRKKHITSIKNSLGDYDNLSSKLSRIIEARKKVIEEVEDMRRKSIELGVLFGNLKGYCEELERRMSEKKALTDELNKIVSNASVYAELTKAFGKDGIQSIIMENITEDLRQYANSALRSIYYKSMSIDFITQKQTAVGDWREDFSIIITIDNEKYDFKDISGGEQVRVSIAIRLALSQILMRRIGSNVKFLLFDEVDQALDKHGIDALADATNNLSKDFKILVITHNDYMKEKINNVITVHMGPAGSVLR